MNIPDSTQSPHFPLPDTAAAAIPTATTFSASGYTRAATAALAAGCALSGSLQKSEAGIVWNHPANNPKLPATTHGLTEILNPEIGENVATNQPIVWFDFLTGKVEFGSAGPKINRDPADCQFGISRLGDIVGLLRSGTAGTRFMLGEDGYVDKYGTYAWPRRLNRGVVIGKRGGSAFMEVTDGINTLAQDQWETSVGLWRFKENPPPVDGFLGLRFSKDEGQTFYNGWAHIILEADYNITVVEFAYNDEAGAQIAVPSKNTALKQQLGTSADTWRAKYFTAEELEDANQEDSLWGNNADPDEDGKSNAMEMLFGTDPKKTDPSDLISVETSGSSAILVYPRSKTFPAALAVVEWSTDMEVWHTYGVTQTVREDLGTFERVAAKYTPATPGGRIFMRLRVGF